MFKYNLQFFGEENKNGNRADTTSSDNSGTDSSDSSGSDNNSGSSGSGEDGGNDVAAFADIISEKDKQIQQLQKDITELKKSNALLTVRVNSGNTPTEFNTEKAILEFCDTRRIAR